jgi:hypothetical protein
MVASRWQTRPPREFQLLSASIPFLRLLWLSQAWAQPAVAEYQWKPLSLILPVAIRYPDMGIAGASSLAATNPSMNVVPGQQLGDMCGGRSVTKTPTITSAACSALLCFTLFLRVDTCSASLTDSFCDSTMLPSAPKPSSGSGSTAAVTLCSSFLPAAGVAAAPYLHPASPSYGYYGPNTFQDPTKWNGDHVLAGGMQEWAAEDAAQHALNLANWRIKLLQAKLEQAKLASQVMNVGDEQTNYLLARKQVAQPAELQLKAMKRQLVSLVGTTSKEIHALTEKAAQQGQRASRHPRRSTVLRTRSSKHSHESYKSKLEALKKSTDKKLADILAQIDKISN